VKPIVFVPEIIAQCGLDLLREDCDCRVPWQDDSSPPEDEQLRETLYAADAVIVRLFTIDERDLQLAKNLKVIGKHGVGVNNIDCGSAAARNIPVVYTPTANSNAVAEHTLAMILTLGRQIVPAQTALKEGRFSERDGFKGIELAGKTLGVIGLGRVGARLSQTAALGLNMTVHGYDPFVDRASYSGPVIIEDSLETLIPIADFLSIHVPLTPQTQHLINEGILKLCKSNCIIVNTSRGGVIDEVALAKALHEGTLAGAALDVFEEEPPLLDHPLCRAPNTLLTPHIAGLTQQSQENMSLQVARGVLDVLHGRPPEHTISM
jgi:D-3-phosphoglycerate dehydrogenase